MRITAAPPPFTRFPQGHSLNPDDFAGMLNACGLGLPLNQFGRSWFVDGNQGNDNATGGDGDPYLTMAKAFTQLQSGDTIYVRGNIREQLNTPAGVFDVAIVGPSPVTRHPDAHTSNGGYSSARWNAPAAPTAATPLLNIRQQGWRIMNVLFTGLSASTIDCIQLFRDGGAGDAERDASHAQIIGCRFQGGRYGIVDSGGCARVFILDNEFLLFSSAGNRAVTKVAGAGIGTKWGWRVQGNHFHANLTDLQADLVGAAITDNHFHRVSLGVTNTLAVDETGGSENLVARNFMYSASDLAASINARFVKVASSSWGPNYYGDKEEYGEPAE